MSAKFTCKGSLTDLSFFEINILETFQDTIWNLPTKSFVLKTKLLIMCEEFKWQNEI